MSDDARPTTSGSPEQDSTGGFFRFTTTRPVAVTMMVLAVVVFGLVGLMRLPVNLLPDISYPTVTIRTEYPGSSPEDVEDRVSERVQEAVSVVPGVRRVVSVSRPGISDVILEFDWGTQMVFAISDIRERLERVFLPKEAERPLVLRYDPSLDPVLTFGLSGEMDLVELRRIADEEVERELAKIEGVAAVKVRGGDEEEIRIDIDEAALTVLDLDVATINSRLTAENINSASGAIDEGSTEYLVRTLGEFRNLDEIADLIIERRGDTPIRLRDIAAVVRVPQDKQVISRVDGKLCVLIDIYKEAGANIVRLAERVRARALGSEAQHDYVALKAEMDALQDKTLPEKTVPEKALSKEEEKEANQERWKRLAYQRAMTDFVAYELNDFGVEIDLLQDQSRFIQSSIDDLKGSAIKGGLFAILVLLLFLRRLSATVILAVSIPVSLVASFAPMFLSDITLNIMSLGGLALGVGMLVDNSIVVLESITKARESGLRIRDAAVQGVSRVASAVTASTLTTVAVFFPIVFVEGVAGQLFRDQSLTVVYSLLMSLMVALFVIPMLASRGSDGPDPRDTDTPPPTKVGAALQRLTSGLMRLFLGAFALVIKVLTFCLRPIGIAFDICWGSLDRAYPRLVASALKLRWAVLGLALLMLALSFGQARSLGNELIPEVTQGEMYVELFLPRDATVERTDAVAGPLEREIAKLPQVERTFLAVGVDKDELNSSEEGEHSAKVLVQLRRSDDLSGAEESVREAVREMIRQRPQILSYRFSRPSVLAFDSPLVVEVVGRDLMALRRVSEQVEGLLRDVEGLRDVRATLQRGNPEIVLHLDRDKMSSLGINSGDVSRILQTKVLGQVPTRFAERDRKIDMRVALPKLDLDRSSRLMAVNVNPQGSPSIPLASIAEFQVLEGPSEIRRIGNARGAEVQAAVVGFDLGTTQAKVERALSTLSLPNGIELRLGGQKEEMGRSLTSVYLALALAIFLVYVVMASQFESLVQPFVILVSLPLAFVGVIFVLSWLSVPVSVIVMLGGIVLAGIVVNNAILLVDAINRLRAEGMPKAEAIVEGAHSRLRPVMMTTMTTVLGLLPLTGWLGGLPLIGGGEEGLELRAPLAVTVVAGLMASTVLTLIVIPLVYSLSDRKA